MRDLEVENSVKKTKTEEKADKNPSFRTLTITILILFLLPITPYPIFLPPKD